MVKESANVHFFCFSLGNLIVIYVLRIFLVNIGTDAILLGAETLRGVYPVETIATVGRICAEVRKLTSHFYSKRLLCHISLYRLAQSF